ncbi:MAG TPA: methyltransferase domain-containing protein [Tepidisphaeraceae bacterium]|jgi:2-polyprenyl-3-methyl-5-hydroxy-6-metoxy-1,4-benzoquinol methylase
MPAIFTSARRFTGEIMDSLDLSAAEHVEALAGLKRINKISSVFRQIARPILRYARAHHLEHLSLMDIACGGGDVPIALAGELSRHGIRVDLMLLDRSATALAQAGALAKQSGISCQLFERDANDLKNLEPADVVTNSLFLHHLEQSGAVIDFLSSVKNLARHMVVISDLRRSSLGLAAAWVGCRILSRSYIVHNDGPASVRAAWTLDELRQLAMRAGMSRAEVHASRPWRMLLVAESQDRAG